MPGEPISESILIVYESPLVRDTIQLLDGTLIPQLAEITDPQTAVDYCREQQPDLTLLCAMTSNTPAFDVCHQLKSDASLALHPVVLLALRDNEETRARAKQASADALLQISIAPDDLLARLRGLLKAHHSFQEMLGENQSTESLLAHLHRVCRRLVELEGELLQRDQTISRLQSELKANR